jgi:hypothetical protein
MKNDHLPRQARDKHRFQTEQNMTAVVLLCRSGGASLDGKKRISVAPFMLKMIVLPRQARDKHRENSKGDAFSYRYPWDGKTLKPQWTAAAAEIATGE